MTTTYNLPQATTAALTQCIAALAHGGPALVNDKSVSTHLRDLAKALQATSPMSIEDTPAAITLTSALSLAATAQQLVALLQTSGSSDALGVETAKSIVAVLDSMSDRLGASLRRENANKIRGLYVIIDPEVTGGREPLDIAKASVQGGAKMLQLRDKMRDKGEILPLALALQELCEAKDVLLIINDHVDLAANVGSGGVHVGQTDLPVAQVRQVLAPHQVLGRSNREIHLLVESQEMGADHVAFGPIYHTDTKGVGRPPQGIERLLLARDAAQTPLVAIGGITAENVAPVIEAGADAICVTAAVGSAPEPEAATAQLVKVIEEAGGRF